MTFFVLGAVLMGIAAATVVHARRDQRRHEAWCASAAHAQGVVSRVGRRHWLSRNEPTSSDRVQTVAVVRFRAANKVEYEFDSPDAPSVAGAAVQVAYDASSPSTARVIQRRPRYGCAIILLGLGLAMIAWELVQRF